MDEAKTGYVYVRLKRPDGYEDVHPELLLEDAKINPAFEPEVVALPQAKAGYRLVPVEPTEEMIDAGCDVDARAIAIAENRRRHPSVPDHATAGQELAIRYRAMLAALPEVRTPDAATEGEPADERGEGA